jgi:hypothetical protein
VAVSLVGGPKAGLHLDRLLNVASALDRFHIETAANDRTVLELEDRDAAPSSLTTSSNPATACCSNHSRAYRSAIPTALAISPGLASGRSARTE